jgi:hypothetical protein
MQAIQRAFHLWLQNLTQIYSHQLLVILILIFIIGRYLVREVDGISNARFVGLSVLAGILGVFGLGAIFHTPTVSELLGIRVGGINEQHLSWAKAVIAITAAGLSVYEGVLIAQKKAPRKIWAKGIGLALAILSIGAYFRYGDFGYQNFYHRHEFFHYYLGSKYDRELGYERLYQCVAVAQADTSAAQANEVRARKMMNLETDFIGPTTDALAHPEQCKDRFTPENWEAFKADVKFFRNSANLQYWNDMQKDHGYNPPPVWTLMGHLWGKAHPATDGYLKFLASFDILLFTGLFAAIYWAFGWRVFAVAAIFWGCQLPAEYFWTGGAFLRQDWLFYLVLSACLLRKRYWTLAGASFAYATLLRIFPGLLVAGLLVVWGTHIYKKKRVAPHHLRVALGGIVAAVALFGISVGVAGWRAWPEFVHHIGVHNSTPLTNNMGLPTVLAHSYAGRMEFVRNEKHLDAFDDWKQMRTARLKAFRPFHVIALVIIAGLLVLVVSRVKSQWVALALSLIVFVGVLEVTCYYYSIFILAAILSRHRRDVEQWILAVAGISQLLAVNHYLSYYYDDRYTAQSYLFCFFALTLLVAYWPMKTTVKAPQGVTAPKPEAAALGSTGNGESAAAGKPAA